MTEQTISDLIIALEMFVRQYGGPEGDPRERRPEIIAARKAIANAESEESDREITKRLTREYQKTHRRNLTPF